MVVDIKYTPLLYPFKDHIIPSRAIVFFASLCRCCTPAVQAAPFKYRGLGVLAPDETPQGSAAGEPADVGAVGDQTTGGLVVVVLLVGGKMFTGRSALKYIELIKPRIKLGIGTCPTKSL